MAGLLLNFETVFTVGLGVLMSGESLRRPGWLGALGVIVGAIVLSLPGGKEASSPPQWEGILFVIGN